jgi:hypothetical protein
MAEKEWVSGLRTNLDNALKVCPAYAEGWQVRVDQGERLTYANEIYRYDKAGEAASQSRKYQTDLLVYDIHENGDWIPRVVIECKMGLNTHDALTYSTKASTHKHVHPYLRYGLLIGGYDTGLPVRAIRHGAYFDFMMYWVSSDFTANEMQELLDVLNEEIRASRTLEGLLGKGESKSKTKVWMLRRQLVVKEIMD